MFQRIHRMERALSSMIKKIITINLLLGLGIGVFSTCFATTYKGDVEIPISNISAINLNGSPAGPKSIRRCRHQYSALLNSKVRIQYKIDTQTLYESATAQQGDTYTALVPLGISGRYDFVSNQPTLSNGLRRILFRMTDQFTNQSINLLYTNHGDPNTLCFLNGESI